MKIDMKVLNEFAQIISKEFWYILISKEVWDATKEIHPINAKHNHPLQQALYRWKCWWYIKTRQRFWNPRIDIYSPWKEWFVALEYKDWKFDQAQIFNEKWSDMFSIIKNRLENKTILWKKFEQLRLYIKQLLNI